MSSRHCCGSYRRPTAEPYPPRLSNRYYESLQARADQFLAAMPQITRRRRVSSSRRAPADPTEERLAAWKRDETEDSAENMSLLMRVSSIQVAEARTQAAA